MGGTLGEAVSAAATRTMRGGAQVGLRVQTSVPDFEALSDFSGVVDFDSDRCRLDGESHIDGETAPESIVLDGPTTYTLESDAQWVFARGAEGTRGMLHPSGLLDALVRAQTSAVEVGERSVELVLDHDVLDAAADAGSAPDWQFGSGGRADFAQRPDLEHRAHAPLRRGPRLSRCASNARSPSPSRSAGSICHRRIRRFRLPPRSNRSTTRPTHSHTAGYRVAGVLSPIRKRDRDCRS